MSELGAPPAPKPAKMPVMTEKDKKQLGVSGPAPAHHGPPAGLPAPIMGYPSVGGMGPNLCFNFYQPYGMAVAAVAETKAEAEEAAKGPKGPPPVVQGDPTWCQPRVVVKKGEKLKPDPCVIM